tara:strand:+ start:267 stop:560 length:294 start_codon:yes stop_codon:yes gene_type:complete
MLTVRDRSAFKASAKRAVEMTQIALTMDVVWMEHVLHPLARTTPPVAVGPFASATHALRVHKTSNVMQAMSALVVSVKQATVTENSTPAKMDSSART